MTVRCPAGKTPVGSRFFRYCLAHELRPGDVSDAVSREFLETSTAEIIHQGPSHYASESLSRMECNDWVVADWPEIGISVPRYAALLARFWRDISCVALQSGPRRSSQP